MSFLKLLFSIISNLVTTLVKPTYIKTGSYWHSGVLFTHSFISIFSDAKGYVLRNILSLLLQITSETSDPNIIRLHIHEIPCPNQTTSSLCYLVYFHVLLKNLESSFRSFSTISTIRTYHFFTEVQSKNLLGSNGNENAKWISKEIHKGNMQTEELTESNQRAPTSSGRVPTIEQH